MATRLGAVTCRHCSRLGFGSRNRENRSCGGGGGGGELGVRGFLLGAFDGAEH